MPSFRRVLLFVLLPVLIVVFTDPYPPQLGVDQFHDGYLQASQKVARILLLTAHPDDECMFFAPTLLHLRESARVAKANQEIYSLCLSSGDADGLGQVRKQELAESLDVLGVHPERRWVLDKPFLDNITLYWDTRTVAQHLKTYVVQHNIDVILTFDYHGVSSHPNHISLARGASALLTHPSFSARIFSLTTVSLPFKYSGPLSVLVSKGTLMFCLLPGIRSIKQVCGNAKLTFVSGVNRYAVALQAMTRHKSQLVWFRWLYVAFSRYMWVNDWVELVL